MKGIKKRLNEKGWSKRDINKTLKIIEKAKKSKHPKIKILDKAVYWFSLLVAVAGNFIITISLIPELIVLEGFQLYLVIITLGVSFGLLFELLVRTIENLKAKHHIFLGTIIPLLAVISFVVILGNMKSLVGIENPHNSLLIGTVYAVAFILPYAVYQTFLKSR
ncbi:hypothetical protein KY347_03405 [Candidatus Woesearchaeota archaeon]|nr:hypothetical protein [Candidatus Woesearchaeota archaeon]